MKKYSITYKPVSDPTKAEQTSLLNALQGKNIRILDDIPGTIAAQGDESLIKKVLDGYPQWSFSSMAKLQH